MVDKYSNQIDIERIPWTCKRCDRTILGIAKLVGHNEEHHPDVSSYICPVCEKLNDDETALKNHILAVHLDPSFLNIKQEPVMADNMEEEDSPSAGFDESEDKGNKKKLPKRRSARKSTKRASFLNEDFDKDDLGPFSTHFLDGYGKVRFNVGFQ